MVPSIPSRHYSRKKNAAASTSEEAADANVEQAEWPMRAAEAQQDVDTIIEETSLNKSVSRNALEERTNTDDILRRNGKDLMGATKDVSNRTSLEEEPAIGNSDATSQDLQLLKHIRSLGEDGFLAWLVTEDQRNGFATFAVATLQEILIRIGRQYTGCKQELIVEVQKFLQERQREGLMEDNECLIPTIEVIKGCTYKHERQQIGQTAMLNKTPLTDMDKKDQATGAGWRRLDSGGESMSPSKLIPQCESEKISLGLEVRLLQEEMNSKEMAKACEDILLIDSNIDKAKKVEIFYTRRSKRKSMVKQIPILEDSKHKLDNLLENSLKGSKKCSYDSLSSLQSGGKKNTVSEPVLPPKKLRLVVKGPRPPETEVLMASKSQDIQVSVMKENPWTMLVHKKVQPGWIAYNPATMRPGLLDTGMLSVKLLSWNVNGIRSLLKEKSQLNESPILKLAQRENFDVLCLQETKLQEKNVMEIEKVILPGYDNSFWSCSTAKLGYSGTAVISRIKPLSVVYGLGIPNHDKEGRLITLEFDNFYLVAGYVPNSGQKLERLAYRTQNWDVSLSNFLKGLEKCKPVIFTGDLNCAHQEMDIYNPDGNRKSAGFTNEERASFEDNFLKRGMVDTFRRQHPQAVAYTYWGHRFDARPRNRGWRLDYFLTSDSISELVHDSYVLPDVVGSDHCPIGLILRV